VIAYIVRTLAQFPSSCSDGAVRKVVVTHPEPWPLRHLVLRTPRLELRPDDDGGLWQLVEVAHGGVHPPEEMPFETPWTDADPEYLGRGTLQFFWGQRAQLSPERWSIHFLVRRDGEVVGLQSLSGTEFRITRVVDTGSWLGLRFQRQGIGTEMRAAVLQFAFDQLGAEQARSSAFEDNPASLRVSQRLGYRADGSYRVARRGVAGRVNRLLLDRDHFVRLDWTVQVDGLDGCRGLLGAG
jgi:RimJ/RimL family protein N-acetyltransferase